MSSGRLLFAGIVLTVLLAGCGSSLARVQPEPLPANQMPGLEGASAVANGAGFDVIGGMAGDKVNGEVSANISTYISSTETWVDGGSYPGGPVWGHTAVLLPDGFVVWGGSSRPDGQADVVDGHRFDRQADEWISLPAGPTTGRFNAEGLAIENSVVLGGGAVWGSGAQQGLDVFNLETEEWSRVPLDGNFIDMAASDESFHLLLGDDNNVWLERRDTDSLSIQEVLTVGETNTIGSTVILSIEPDVAVFTSDPGGNIEIHRQSQDEPRFEVNNVDFGEDGALLSAIGVRGRDNTSVSNLSSSSRLVSGPEGVWVYDGDAESVSIVEDLCAPNAAISEREEGAFYIWGGQDCFGNIGLQTNQGFLID